MNRLHLNKKSFFIKLAYTAITLFIIGSCSKTQQHLTIKTIPIEVTGHEFNWYFRYPGYDGLLHTDDDQHSIQNLFLPNNAHVHLTLKSKDYVYSFALPELGLKEIAVPELDFVLQFNTGTVRTLQLRGDQFCGYSHKTLIGTVYVRNQDKGFYGWPE